MSFDPERASRVLDLLEAATQRGDLGKDEAASILSSWLAEQKRHSWGGSVGGHDSLRPGATLVQPLQHRSLRNRQSRGLSWRRWFAACFVGDTVAEAHDHLPTLTLPTQSQQPTRRISRPQTPLPSPPSLAHPTGHEYALYGGVQLQQQRHQSHGVEDGGYEDYEECSAVVAEEEDEASPSSFTTVSNTADSGVFNC